MSTPHQSDTTTNIYTEANRQHFNKKASSADAQPLAQKVARVVSAAILEAYDFDEDTTTVLDFACGTGLISQALAPYCKQLVGVDVSQGMVDHFNARVENQGIPFDEMKAICIDLKGKEGELDGMKFDVVVCSQAYHHFPSIETVTSVLTTFLKPGGSLMVVDLIKNKAALEFHDKAIKVLNAEYETTTVDDACDAKQRAKEDKGRSAGDDSDVNIGYGHDHSGHIHEHKHDDHHSHHHIVAHKGGFVESDIRQAFDAAGLRDFEWSVAGSFTPIRGRKKAELFLAMGNK